MLKDQLNQSKYYMTRANEASQQILLLEEEINKLKSALIAKGGEYDRKCQEFMDLQRRISIFEEQITELRRSN